MGGSQLLGAHPGCSQNLRLRKEQQQEKDFRARETVTENLINRQK